MGHLFWLADEKWAVIEPDLPNDQLGTRRTDDRWVISGTIHVLKTGYRWCDYPSNYSPPMAI